MATTFVCVMLLFVSIGVVKSPKIRNCYAVTIVLADSNQLEQVPHFATSVSVVAFVHVAYLDPPF